jgi:hypothetical protein
MKKKRVIIFSETGFLWFQEVVEIEEVCSGEFWDGSWWERWVWSGWRFQICDMESTEFFDKKFNQDALLKITVKNWWSFFRNIN